MRIISQDGMFDVPYEKVIVQLSSGGNNNIIAYTNEDQNGSLTMAVYSTEAKAKRAMEMLRNEYHGYKVEEVYHEGTEYYHPIFQFPADDEINV